MGEIPTTNMLWTPARGSRRPTVYPQPVTKDVLSIQTVLLVTGLQGCASISALDELTPSKQTTKAGLKKPRREARRISISLPGKRVRVPRTFTRRSRRIIMKSPPARQTSE
jgi:hypothetical protein